MEAFFDVFVAYVVVGLVVVLLFGITVFVHELGHFLAAISCGMVVKTFSIGMGPALWQKKIRGVVYKIAWFPIGGYVALPQLDPAGMEHLQDGQTADNGPQTTDQASDGLAEQKPGAADAGQEQGLQSAVGGPQSDSDAAAGEEEIPPIAFWKKLVVAVAGPLGNILLAILLAHIIYWAPESIPEDANTQVGYVATNSAAFAAGLRTGDEIRTVNGARVTSWREFVIECHLVGGGSNMVSLALARGEGNVSCQVPTTEIAKSLYGVAGVVPASICVIRGVVEGGAAEAAGLKPQDVVLAFNDVDVASVSHMVDLVAMRGGQSTPVRVDRLGESLEFQVTPSFSDAHQRALIGVELRGKEIFTMAWMRYKNPWAQIGNDAKEIFRILKALTSSRKGEARRAAGALSGPIGIIWILWTAVQAGLLNTVGFLRLLNVNLAVLNLLPLPVLDGGHIMFGAYEGITGKRVHPKVVNVLINVFIVLLLTAFVLISVGDCRRLAGDKFSRFFARFKKEAPIEQVEEGQTTDRRAQTADPGESGQTTGNGPRTADPGEIE